MEKIRIQTSRFLVRQTESRDFPGIQALCQIVYPFSGPYTTEQLQSHVDVFPEGQLVAIDLLDQRIVGMAASLVLYWDDYDAGQPWREFTDHGFFTNHDPQKGRTLYGAEVMVNPKYRGKGVGKLLYKGRRQIVRRLGLKRIRAGARLRGYSKVAEKLSAEQYLQKISDQKLSDPTISFQLKQGFKICGLVDGYLQHDPESLGNAAIIEWLNDAFREEDYVPPAKKVQGSSSGNEPQ